MCADWLKRVFLSLDRNTELAQAVDIMMVRAKRIYILMIKVNKLFPFFFTCFPCFYRVIETLVKVWENLKKLACVRTAFLVLPNFHLCLYNSIEVRDMFSIS